MRVEERVFYVSLEMEPGFFDVIMFVITSRTLHAFVFTLLSLGFIVFSLESPMFSLTFPPFLFLSGGNFVCVFFHSPCDMFVISSLCFR